MKWKTIANWIVWIVFGVGVYAIWILVGRKIVPGKARFGKIDRWGNDDEPMGDPFVRIPGKPNTIMVQRAKNDWIEVDVPGGLPAKNVLATQIVEQKNEVLVEIKHKTTDRTVDRGTSDPPADRLGLR